jgi:hypothetical protein
MLAVNNTESRYGVYENFLSLNWPKNCSTIKSLLKIERLFALVKPLAYY